MDDPLAELRGVSGLRLRSLLMDRPAWLVPTLVGVVASVLVFGFLVSQVLAPEAPAPESYLPAADSIQFPSTSSVVPQGTGTVTVHVAGAVASPGLVETDQGMRVGDAVELAGGALVKADIDRLNLAEPLVDGVRVYVPRIGEDFVVEPLATSGVEGSDEPAVVNINTADSAELETLPGIGPVTAAAIIDYRNDNGEFGAIEDIDLVSGIGPKTMADLLPLLTVGS